MSVTTISDGTFSKTVDTNKPTPTLKIKKTKRYWRKGKQERADYLDRKKKGLKPTGKVSTAIRERLYLEAEASPAYYGMDRAEVRHFIDTKLDAFLSRQPWWYGGTPGADAKHRASQRAHEARQGYLTSEPQEDQCTL